MPTAETLRALLAQVEEAKAGSRELDIELWALHGDRRVRDVEGKLAYYETVKDGLWIRSRKPLRSLVPFYTTSIDAALALVAKVLPGWIVERMSDQASGHIGALKPFGACVELTDGDRVRQGFGASRPLAILAALLRALLQQSETSHVER